MSISTYPDQYLRFNTQQTKNPVIVVSIGGVDLLTSAPIYQKIHYGDVGLVYGLPGIVYGGLKRIDGVRDILSLDGSSLTIGQKVEPEQGRSSVSILSLSFIDQAEYMSQVISPGVILDEILGKKIRIYLGYQPTSFPEDFFTIFRGYVTGVTSMSGMVTLQLSDANFKKRQSIAYTQNTTTTGSIDASTHVIPVVNHSDFHQQILGPDGTYDSGVKTYLKVEDEYMEYGPAGLSTPGQVTVLSRGARGSTAKSHDGGTQVNPTIEITGNAIDILLKLSLSGWGGPYLDSIPVFSFRSMQTTTLADQPNAFVLPSGTNGFDDLGLSVGDYFTITGSSAGNNKTGRITSLGKWEDQLNRVVYTDQTFNLETPITTAQVAFRSQFDTYPLSLGMKLDPTDVDVPTHVQIKNDFLINDNYQFHIQAAFNGKTFIESEICLPEGIYPISRYGRISLNITRPAIADQLLVELNEDNILNPESISINRATNNRKFFNDISYNYDKTDADTFANTLRLVDFDSLNSIGTSVTLPISSSGLKSALSGGAIATRRGRFLLSRYSKGAFEITFQINWQAGTLIEAGDIVVLKDNGTLQVTNFNDGTRNLGTQLYEVIDRKFDLKSGKVTLTLLSNTGFDITDRYATISPSSICDSGSTGSELILKDSFGGIFPGEEHKKWDQYLGLPVRIRNLDYSRDYTSTFIGFDTTNVNKMLIDPPIPVVSSSGMIVDIASYPTTTDPKENELYKVVHASITPTVVITSGTSQTVFHVSPSDNDKFQVGLPVFVHNTNYSSFSIESNVVSAVGGMITVAKPLGFIPASGFVVELIGFADHKGAYRIV